MCPARTAASTTYGTERLTNLLGGSGGGGFQSSGGNGGGGGGGGRVAIYCDDDLGITMEAPYTSVPPNILLDGGLRGDWEDNGSAAEDGEPGTFYAGPAPKFIKRGVVIIVR